MAKQRWKKYPATLEEKVFNKSLMFARMLGPKLKLYKKGTRKGVSGFKCIIDGATLIWISKAPP